MKNNNNIDKLFRDKLSGMEVEFNPDAWTKMEGLIVEQEKKKRRGVVIFFSGLAAAVLLILGVYLFNNNGQYNSVEQNIVTEKKADQSETNTENNTETQANENGTKTVDVEEDSKQNLVADQNNIDNQIVEKQSHVEDEQLSESVSLKKQEPKNTTTPVGGMIASNEVKDEFDYAMNVVYVDTTKKEEELSLKEKIQQKRQINHQEKLVLMEYKLAKLKVDESSDEIGKRETEKSQKEWLSKFNVNVIAGVNVSQGFLNSDLSRAVPSLDPTAGVGVSYILNSLVSLDANALYHQRGGLSQEKLPEEYVEIGTSEVAKKLYYIDVPFYLNYRFKNRHAVRFGLQYSQLINTKVEVMDNTSTITYKHQSYFANYDMAGIIGYKYLVNERFNIGVRGNFGLFDVTLGQQPKENTFDMNRQLRFLIEYKLLKN